MNPTKQILLNQMNIFEILLKTEVLLDPIDLKIYSIKGDFIVPTLLPEEYHPISWLNEKKMLSREDFEKSEKLEILQENNGISTEVVRNTLRNTNGISTEIQQNSYGNTTDYLQKINRILTDLSQERSYKFNKISAKYFTSITENYEDVKPFSYRYKNKIKEYAEQIEAYTYSSLFTTKKATIKNIRTDFEYAKNLALKGKIIKLEELRDKIKDRRIKQTKTNAITNAANKKANKKRIRITLLISLFVLLAIFAISKQIFNSITTPLQHKIEYYQYSDIEDLIFEYENKNNTKIYKWRRTQISEHISNKFTKKELFEMCDINYKFK